MISKSRKLLIAAAVGIVFLVAAAVVIHLPSVQRSFWDRVTAAIEKRSGWKIEAGDFNLRALPARLRANTVAVSFEDSTVVTLDRLEARWRWLAVVSRPYRIESLLFEGVEFAPSALPGESGAESEAGIDPWELVEIGELRILGGSGAYLLDGAEVVVDGVSVEGGLVSGHAEVVVETERLSLARGGRLLELGPCDIDVQASPERMRIERFEVGSTAARLSVTGEIEEALAASGHFEIVAGADLETVARWWDPNLATGLEADGRLELEGHVSVRNGEVAELELEHRGEPVEMAGYGLNEFDLVFRDGRPRVRVAGPGWGRAAVTMTVPRVAEVSAEFFDAPVDRFLAFAVPRVAERVGSPVTVSGEIDGTISYPVVPERLAGRVDLEIRSALGRVAVRGDGSGREWHVEDLDAWVMGANLQASGSVDAQSRVEAVALLTASDPGRVVGAIGSWLPIPDGWTVDGGPLEARLEVGGPVSSPDVSATFEWSELLVGGHRIDGVEARVSGRLDGLDWEVDASISRGTTLLAAGTARPMEGAAEGEWRIRASNLEELAGVVAVIPEWTPRGRLTATGDVALSDGEVRIEGGVTAPRVALGEWWIENLRAEFVATRQAVEVVHFEAEALSGTIEGAFALPLADRNAVLRADLRWRDVPLRPLPLELPDTALGSVSGGLQIDGSIARPQGTLDLSWVPAQSAAPIEALGLRAGLAEGVVTIASTHVQTAGGPVAFDLEAPLGDFELPEWLWPDAPGGVVRGTVQAPGFQSRPLMEAFGQEGLPADIEADLRANAVWNPLTPEEPSLLLEADNLRLRHASGDLVAEGPLVVSLKGDRLELAPVVLSGLGSRIEASAAYDPATQLVTGRLRALVSSEAAAMLPVPFALDGPMTVKADFNLPADDPLSIEQVRGELTIDHSEGRIVMRDPPVEIRGFRVVAALDDGVLDILDGGAEVNRGRVDLGGGWDPSTGQGLVFELDDVTTLVSGILTKWDGMLAVEPRANRLALVSGDLTLEAGLWDERFDIASAVLADQTTATTGDDFLHDIGLDLTVRGLVGIRVENNLGRFDVNWDQLRVGGTAAVPVIRGEVRIAPGGTLALAGQEISVRRGVLEFTGNPDVDPLMEIVPETDTTLFGAGGEIEATEIATRGLAQGITSALGFENETLRPAEIAVQTESDPSTRFMVGQRLSRQLALFLAANLTDVQDRLTMLQYWNHPRFRGLALQAYQETADDNVGANIFQRFEWGGARIRSDRPEIHRVRLDGEWPVSKSKLRRATRLRRGQPYDKFLLFVGAVRIERVLAEHGYQDARVIGVEEGAEFAPTAVFSGDPGVPQPVVFEGDDLPDVVRREVTALYQGPPLEGGSFDAMRSEVRRQVVSEGYLSPEINVERRDQVIVVDVRKGQRTELLGPFLEGMPVDSVVPVVRVIGSGAALATTVDRPRWAANVIERILRGSGYLEAKVVKVSMKPVEGGKAEVHIEIESGRRETLASVKIVGEDPLGLTTDTGFGVRTGMPLDRPVIDSAIRDLRLAYAEEGYRDVSVRSSIEQVRGGGWRVEILIDPGRRRTVREVRFVGHRDVSENVLLKGVTVAPGEVLTQGDLDRSASRIANFSPVERAAVDTTVVQNSQVDLEFDVVEKRRWTLEAGGGWSTERGFGAVFGARDDNLFGRGVGLNLRGSLDSVAKKVFLLGSLPPVPGGRLSFITTIGYTTGDAPDDPKDLNQDQSLASFEASYSLPKNVQVGVYYRWTDTRTYEKVPDEFFPLDIEVQIGTVGARTVIERFDYLFDPRKGWGLTSDLGWSGAAIGSDLEYVSWLSGFTLALEPFRDTTWLQSIRVGVAEPLKGTSLDREARFFAGGQASIRGFDLNSVGPPTFGTGGTLVPAGGGALFVLNEELRIPIWDPLRLAVFADVGQVWESWREADSDLSLGVGLGVRWSTPIGPLWADVAWPVANIGISSKKPKFYLGIGRPF